MRTENRTCLLPQAEGQDEGGVKQSVGLFKSPHPNPLQEGRGGCETAVILNLRMRCSTDEVSRILAK